MSKPGAKEKEKTIPEKLKNFFRLAPKPTAANSSGTRQRIEGFVVTAEVIKEVSAESTMPTRLKALRDLTETVVARRLEENAVEALWYACHDLLQPSVTKDARHTTLVFIKALVQGQWEKLGIVRARIFAFVEKHSVPEDLMLRFDILVELSSNGRDIQYFEEYMGPLLLSWMQEILSSPRANDFLMLLVNTIKYNSAYLEDHVVAALVKNTCAYAGHTSSEDGIVCCLSVLDVVVRYGCLLPDELNTVISTLCHTVNAEKFLLASWSLMRHLLGTHLGHRSMCNLCSIVQSKSTDTELLRGAIFFIAMGLWGHQRVTSLQHPALAVLPSFLLCVRNNINFVVAMEIGLALQRLVNKFGKILYVVTWDLVLDLLEELFVEGAKTPTLATLVTEILAKIEDLYSAAQYSGSVERLWSIIEKCAIKMPETSVLRLIDYKAQAVKPLRAAWLTHLHQLVERFFRNETRTKVRIRALDVLKTVFRDNQHTYEEEIMDKVVLSLLRHVEMEPDLRVSIVAVELLVTLAAECRSKRCLDLLDVINRVVSRPLEQSKQAADVLHILNNEELAPVQTAVLGLIDVFKGKFCRLPSSHAVRAFTILVSHLQSHYDGPIIVCGSNLRAKVLECLLLMRCNALNQVGMVGSDGKVTFSPYLICASGNEKMAAAAASPPIASPTPFSTTPCVTTPLHFAGALAAITTCLQKDKDWDVLRLVLEQLPCLMQNRMLLLSSNGTMAQLCGVLCGMVSDRSLGLPDSLQNAPLTFSRSDFHAFVLPVLAALVSFHKHLDGNLQRRLVKCLEFGLVSRCARICINALTVCTLEMHETMYKLLPEVLLSLSKISATVGIATPILEFLSSLIRLPRLYTSFVEDQYMSIFAIALPYVNPFKFNHYTVALAYHVIAMWFLKCRLSFRRDFVKFIVKGLQSNVLIPLDEGELAVVNQNSLMEDSSQRRRASSMNDQALAARRRDRAMVMSGGAIPSGENSRPIITRAVKELNTELTETCIDLMARYAFAACSALPRRFPASEFLLAGGQSQTWLLGTKLVTVTTSGCSSHVLKHGLCDKCLSLCRAEGVNAEDGMQAGGDGHPARRRHRSAIQRSVTTELAPVPMSRTKDDLQLRRSLFAEESTITESGTIDAKHSPLGQDGVLQEPETKHLDRLLFGVQEPLAASSTPANPPISQPHLCNCWCQGWAEILVRHPTGNVSWMTRIQNPPHLASASSDFPLADISTLFLGSRGQTLQNRETDELEIYDTMTGHRRIDSESLDDKEYEKIYLQHFDYRPLEHRKPNLPMLQLFDQSGQAPKIQPNLPHRRTRSTPDLRAACENSPGESAAEKAKVSTAKVSLRSGRLHYKYNSLDFVLENCVELW